MQNFQTNTNLLTHFYLIILKKAYSDTHKTFVNMMFQIDILSFIFMSNLCFKLNSN